MAWKKVIVSGSNISELANDAGYVSSQGQGLVSSSVFTSTAQGTVTASINGVATKLDLGLQTTDRVTFADVTASLKGSVTGNVTGDLTGTADTASYVAFSSIDGEVVATTASYVELDNVDGFTAHSSSLSGRVRVLEVNGPTNASTASFVDSDNVEFIGGNGQTATQVSSSAAGRLKTLEGTGTIQGVGTTNNVTFGNITATGNLTVQGSVTSVETTNLNVTDQFVLLASGSTSAVDGGFVFEGQNSALGWDAGQSRFAGRYEGAAWDDTTLAPDAFVSMVVTGDNVNYEKAGNIKIESDTIYIYV